MDTPIYPPRVQATILAFERGRLLPDDEAVARRGQVSDAEVERECRFDWWRSLMDDDAAPARAGRVFT